MFSRKKPVAPTDLDETIAELERTMTISDGGSKEHTAMLTSLERLYKLKEKTSPKRVDPNTWLIVGGNLAGILILVVYEHAHVIGSRVTASQIGKLR